MEIKDIISSGLLELYAAGLASKEEALMVQEWIVKYPEVASELAAIEAGIHAYAGSYAIQPDASVKAKILTRIHSAEKGREAPLPANSSTGKEIAIPAYWKWLAAASVIILLGSTVLNVLMFSKYNNTDKDLQATRQILEGLQKKNKIIEENMQVMQDKNSLPVLLSGLEAAPDATAKVFWKQNTGEVYLDPGNLPDAPEGKQYQLWAIVDGKPVDAGMIDAASTEDKQRIQKMKVFPKAEAFAISLEAEKGNTAPKGPIFVMGKV